MILSRILQSIGQESLTGYLIASIRCIWIIRYLLLATSITLRRFSISSQQRVKAAQNMVLHIYLSTLTSLIMLPFDQLLVPRSYLSYLGLSMKMTPIKIQTVRLSLEMLWVNQCGWICLCNAVAIGMTVTNFWKIFCHGVKK